MTRTLALVLALVVLAIVVLVNLTILDVFTVEEMRNTTSDLLAIGVVTAAGLVVLMALLRLARPRSEPPDADRR